jgi:hypothetical protein
MKITIKNLLNAIDFFGVVNPVFYKKDKESKSIFSHIISLLSISSLIIMLTY